MNRFVTFKSFVSEHYAKICILINFLWKFSQSYWSKSGWTKRNSIIIHENDDWSNPTKKTVINCLNVEHSLMQFHFQNVTFVILRLISPFTLFSYHTQKKNEAERRAILFFWVIFLHISKMWIKTPFLLY